MGTSTQHLRFLPCKLSSWPLSWSSWHQRGASRGTGMVRDHLLLDPAGTDSVLHSSLSTFVFRGHQLHMATFSPSPLDSIR